MDQLPLFVEPGSPDLKPILEIHRGHDGYVSFHRKDDQGNHQDLCSVPAKTLDGIFPQLSPVLETDSYFSINGFWRGGHGVARHSPAGLELPRAHRLTKDLRWLTCCFADLDCHALGIEPGTAIGAIINAQDRGDIPPASMLTRSGRGVWCFWFLTGEDGAGLQRAYAEKVQLWAAVQRTIGERLAWLGADAVARDAARITRIAGSVNSKAGARVGYWVQHRQDNGKRYTYTLSEIADLLGVSVQRQPRLDQAASVVSELAKYGRQGAMARWSKDLDRFQRLEELRGQWRSGQRNNAVFVLAAILRSLKKHPDLLTGDDILTAVRRTWERCEQVAGNSFTWSEAAAILRKSEGGTRPISHQTIADLLDVTPDEAPVVGWPAAKRFGGQEQRVELTRAESQDQRRQLLRIWITGLGYTPTAAVAVEFLSEQGIDCVTNTVLKDMNAIGFPVPKSRRRKKPKTDANKRRKLFE